MTNPHRAALLTALQVLDLAIVAGALVMAVGASVQHEGSWIGILEMRIRVRNLVFLSLYFVYWHAALRGFGLYRSYRLAPNTREWRNLGWATLVGTLPLWLSADVLHFEFATPRFFTLFVTLAFVGLVAERRCLRVVARGMRRYGRNLRNVVLIGSGEASFELASSLARRADLGYHIVEAIDIGGWQGNTSDVTSQVLGRLAALFEGLPVDEVFLALPLDTAHPMLRSVVALCEEQGIAVRVLSSVVDLLLARAQVDEIDGRPVITIFSGPPDSAQLLAKRVIDVALSSVALVVLLPILALVALAIRLDSPGPALFVQERVGFGGRRFRLYKFRTMVDEAERQQEALEALNEAHGPVFKIRSDPRVTRVGRVIRRFSADELPQLLNVLKGDMSLVGPRPLPLRDVARIDVRAHKRRFSVRPGITCLWQVSGREPEFDEWIRSDMEYIDNWSLVLDTKILAKTIPTVLSGRGAY
jgi:exopolysaccharide biosynthesis polyprenyl glycosylphosphotransferase